MTKKHLTTARALIREEGLLIGGSCGSAMFAALTSSKIAQKRAKLLSNTT